MRYGTNLSGLVPMDINPLGDADAGIGARLDEVDKARKYLIALCGGWSKSRACLAAKIDVSKPRHWRRLSATFTEIEQDCLQAGDDMTEDVAHHLAVIGEAQYQVVKDAEGNAKKVKVGTKRDTQLLRTLLAGRKPDKYGTNRVAVQSSHTHAITAGESILAALEERMTPAIDAEFREVEHAESS